MSVEQGTEPSIESRIGNVFGDEPEVKAPAPEPDAQASEEAAPAPEETDTGLQTAEDIFEFEQDGQKYALPKALEKAVMQERDYTQKSQTLADQKRSVEFLHEQAKTLNMRTEFETSVAQEIQQFQAYEAVLKQPVDWNALTTDEAFRKKIQLDQWKTERDDIGKSLQAKHQQFAQKMDETFKDLQKKGEEVVSKKVPNWTADTWKAIAEHAKNDGYTDTELSSIADPRHKLTLWKAQQFDQLKAKATKTVSDVKTVKTTPSNPMPQHVKDKLAYRKEVAKAAPGSKVQQDMVKDRIAKMFG